MRRKSVPAALSSPLVPVRDRLSAAAPLTLTSARALIDCLPAQIVLLDEEGTIIGTNRAWRSFGEIHGADPEKVGNGVNYLGICDVARGSDWDTQRFATGLRSVLAGHRNRFEMLSTEAMVGEGRRYKRSVRRLSDPVRTYVLVAHEDLAGAPAPRAA